jgi:ATP-dependent DNA helicase RecQ
MKITKPLKTAMERMGFDQIRDGQMPVIESVMKREDVLATMPTGAGKSATFILPTLAKNWRCLIISPLISLQTDQVRKLVDRGIDAAAINSNQTMQDNHRALLRWREGTLNFLYVAPERLDNQGFRNDILQYKPDLLVVDEVHCISMWAADFRPAYKRLGPLAKELRPAAILGLTATLTPDAEDDVRECMGMRKAKKLVYYRRRDNLEFVTLAGNEMEIVADAARAATGSAIIYSTTVAKIENYLFPSLSSELTGGVVRYHGRMAAGERTAAQEMFMNGQAKYVIATNAFGMGVDKADVRLIMHADLPGSVASYVQEAGRAGRDDKTSICAIGYDQKSIGTQKFFLETRNPPRYFYEQLWKYLVSIDAASGSIKPINSMSRTMCRGKKWAEAKISRQISAAMSVLRGAGYLDRSSVKGYRAKKTTLLKDNLDGMDWERLELKTKTEERQLQQMIEFAGLKDNRKHAALEEYFETGELPDVD